MPVHGTIALCLLVCHSVYHSICMLINSIQCCALILAGLGGARPSSSQGKLSWRHQAVCLFVCLSCLCLIATSCISIGTSPSSSSNASCIDKCTDLGFDCRSPSAEPLLPRHGVLAMVLDWTSSRRWPPLRFSVVLSSCVEAPVGLWSACSFQLICSSMHSIFQGYM